MKILVLVPAYNEEKVINCVLKSIKRELKKTNDFEIVVIDDGSLDNTFQEAEKEADLVLRHPINRGLGGAIGTGLTYAKSKRAKLVVTFDADGQHHPQDIKRVITPILEDRADVVIGSRTLMKTNKIPFDRKAIIWGSNLLTKLFFGMNTTDSQSGMRAFSGRVVREMKIRTQGMEVSTEFFSEIKRLNCRFEEVPIRVVYTSYSRRKGQSNLNALSVLIKLLLRLAR